MALIHTISVMVQFRFIPQASCSLDWNCLLTIVETNVLLILKWNLVPPFSSDFEIKNPQYQFEDYHILFYLDIFLQSLYSVKIKHI